MVPKKTMGLKLNSNNDHYILTVFIQGIVASDRYKTRVTFFPHTMEACWQPVTDPCSEEAMGTLELFEHMFCQHQLSLVLVDFPL